MSRGHPVSEDVRASRRRVDQAKHHPQGRCLSGAVRAEEAEDLTAADCEAKACDSPDAASERLTEFRETYSLVIYRHHGSAGAHEREVVVARGNSFDVAETGVLQ